MQGETVSRKRWPTKQTQKSKLKKSQIIVCEANVFNESNVYVYNRMHNQSTKIDTVKSNEYLLTVNICA